MYIEEIRDTDKCVGCGNCKNICPVHAISMVEDKEGFLIPKINHNRCIKCSKCEKSCPNQALRYKEKNKLPDAFLVRSTNEIELESTASGGVCTLLSQYFIREKKGYVCGAIYDDNFKVIHIVTNNLSDVERMRQSKYVQSDLKNCFVDIKEKLTNKMNVLFIGTGCQVYALKKYLHEEYDTLFCIDLICHGTPSPKAQKEYIKYLENRNGKIKNINNRHKKLYTHSYSSTYFVEFENGEKNIKQYSDDPMADAFFSHLSIRSVCFNCAFKFLHRISDITVGDFWFSEQFGFGEDLLGINLCLVQSSKGAELLKFIANKTESRSIDSNIAILLNGGMLYSSCSANKNRTIFFEKLGHERFDKLVFKYDGKSKMSRLKNNIRKLIAPILRATRYYNKQMIKSASMRGKRKIPEERKGLIYYDSF